MNSNDHKLFLRTSETEFEFEHLSPTKKSKTFRRNANEMTEKLCKKIAAHLYKIYKTQNKRQIMLESNTNKSGVKTKHIISSNFNAIKSEQNSGPLDSTLPLSKCLNCETQGFDELRFVVFVDTNLIFDLPVILNPPTLDNIQLNIAALEMNPMVGVELFCEVDHRYCDEISFKWTRVEDDVLLCCLTVDSCYNSAKSSNSYTPTISDIGHHLVCSVQCGSVSQGPELTITTNLPVKEHSTLKNKFPFEDRAAQLKPSENDTTFRVTTYNILFCEDSRDAWSQVSTEHLSLSYRLPILTKEILGYNSDIIGLQEVTTKVFQNWLVPTLEHKYTGVLAKRNESNSVAMFWDKNRYRFEGSFDCNIEKIPKCRSIEDLLKEFGAERLVGKTIGDKDNAEIDKFKTFYLDNFPEMEKEHPVLFKEMCTPRTVVQIVTLFDKRAEEYLIIANTHLTGNHRKYGHVRPFQGKVLADCVLMAELVLKTEHPSTVSVNKMVLGDLNCQPNWPTAQLLTKREKNVKVPSLWFKTDPSILSKFGIRKSQLDSHRSSKCAGEELEQQMSEYERKLTRDSVELETVDQNRYHNWLETYLALINALDCEKVTVTSFTKFYRQVIDHIFYDDEMVEVEYVLETPENEVLEEEVALPSSKFPSDHLAQVVSFSWK